MISSKIPSYFQESSLKCEDFDAICSQKTNRKAYPLAKAVEQNILIYEGKKCREALKDPNEEKALKIELCRALREGPGVFVIKKAYEDDRIIDRMTEIFQKIVAEENTSGKGKGDHFGSNERIWNSSQKACLKDPDLFIDYYGNSLLALSCHAWLGPFYQITSQMNNVKPQNKAQSMHRDYHLGFQSRETIALFPAHVQIISPYLTLQGAIAHSDIALESGPTLLLPFSHQYEPGYLAYQKPEFIAYFDQHKVQLPFSKGDMIFFSPALFHGSGSNSSAHDRLVNLIQISSAFGRAMENIATTAMAKKTYPSLLSRVQKGSISERSLHDTIAALAEGYSFPTNLDSDPPLGGNAPETGEQLMARALKEKWSSEQFNSMLDAQEKRRRA